MMGHDLDLKTLQPQFQQDLDDICWIAFGVPLKDMLEDNKPNKQLQRLWGIIIALHHHLCEQECTNDLSDMTSLHKYEPLK